MAANWLRHVAFGFIGTVALACSSGSDPNEDVGRVAQATNPSTSCLSAPLAGECRYSPIEAIASSVEGGSSAYVASNAIDSDCSSRWSSAFSDPQWLKVDLGSSRPLSRVVVHWENAASSSYELQVSADANTWTKVATKANATITGSGSTRVDTIAGLTASARYVRLYSLARTTSYGNSVFELEVFGTACAAAPSCSQIPVIPVAATASSQESTDKGASKAIDGSSSTRWSSAFSDPQWLQLDLGQTISVGRVSLDWENSASANYQIQVSDSPTGPYTVLNTHADSHVGPRKDDISGLSGSGRYLRIYSTRRTTSYGVSLFEVRVFRGSCTGCEQVLVPTAVAASSIEQSAFPASKAIDGDYNTRWSSQFSDPQWLRLDFGQPRRINQVIIRWEASAAAKSYRLETSASSAGPWQQIAKRDNQPAGARWDFITGLDATARFLRVNALTRNGSYGDSIYEIVPLGSSLEPVCSGHGQCIEANPPGQKVCDCDLSYTGTSCGTSTQPNSDGDPIIDIEDGCPRDPLKTAPQVCGCGVSEVDTDHDKVPDCEDFCPNDPNNQIATPCGCAGQNNFLPSGARCIVEGCSGSEQEATCNGQGQCGAPDCAPQAQGCFFVVFRDHGYWFCGGNVSWQQAENFCGDEPGRSLVQVNDRVENEWLSSVLSQDTWLGGNALVDGENWAWSHNGIQNATPFWMNGLPVPGGYTRWQPAAPGAGQCLKLLDNATWSDASCAETHGFVCEQPVLRLPPPIDPPCACDYFPGASCSSCGATSGTPPDCVEGSVAFPHTPGNPDTAVDNDPNSAGPGASNPDFEKVKELSATCKANCLGEDDPNCATACQGFAAVPPPGSKCDPFTTDQRAFCDLLPDSIHPTDTCSLTKPCDTAGYQCGRRYECAALESDFSTRPCRGTIDCAGGQYCGDHPHVCMDPNLHAQCDTKVTDAEGKEHCVGICFGSFACGKPRPECAVNAPDAHLNRCSVTNICPDPGTVDLNTNPAFDDKSNLKPVEFPANEFFPVIPDDAATPFKDAKPDGCGDPNNPCHYEIGKHPWCNFVLDPHPDVSKNASDSDSAFKDKKGTGGSKGPITFDFDPNLDIGFEITDPLPMGDAKFDAHANASATAGAHFKLFGLGGDISILDAAAGLDVNRCGVSHQARLKLFGYDFLPALLGDEVNGKLSALDTPDDVRDTCEKTREKIHAIVDRAQKALRDAQEMIRQEKTLVAQGQRFRPDFCHQLLETRGVPADFPSAAAPFRGCGTMTPRDTINLFIDYYQGQVAALKTQLTDLIPEVVPSVPPVKIDFLQKLDASGGGEVDEAHRETQQIANINFAIGPIPMNLTIEAFVQYGMAGNLTFGLTPAGLLHAYDSDSPEELAHVDASVTPFAGAGVTLFLGIGFDWGALSAKVGISGEVSLGLVTLPIYAGASLKVKAENDGRSLPGDMDGMLVPGAGMIFPPGPPKKFSFMAGYKFGLEANIQKVLQGHIDAALRIEFFWFSKTWQKQVASFGPAVDPIKIALIHGGGDAKFADATGMLGFIHMPLAFVKFARVDEPPALPPLDTGGTGGTGAGGSSSGGTSSGGSSGTGTGGTGGNNRPPVSLLFEGDPRYQNFSYDRVDKLFYAGYCDCSEGGGATPGHPGCSNDLDCCTGKFCVLNDQVSVQQCQSCVQLINPVLGQGEQCKTNDQCCDKDGEAHATCRKVLQSDGTEGNISYCQTCVPRLGPVADINQNSIADHNECCGDSQVAYRAPGATAKPVCRACGTGTESCNRDSDCCDFDRLLDPIHCVANRCSGPPK